MPSLFKAKTFAQRARETGRVANPEVQRDDDPADAAQTPSGRRVSSYNGRMTSISGRLIAAARALVGVSQADFAAACGLEADTLCRLEAGGNAHVSPAADVDAVMRGLGHFGVLIVEEADGMGAGVRLKFTRADVRQIARLEGEGGVIGSDDAP
jgi:transcriptional regulator with XRE-family HTH domain